MSKNIVLCIDGTGNGPGGAEATNVWAVFEAVAEARGRQVKCYLPGVGVKDTAPVCRFGPDWKRIARLRPPSDLLPAWLARFGPGGRALGLGTGLGTADRITRAYAFLCHHYVPGDRIYLFGFSRGATAVRSLAGFLDTVGVLLHDKLEHVAEAYRLYVHPKASVRQELPGLLRRVTGVWVQPRGTYARLRRGGQTEPGRTLPARYRMSAHFLGVWDTVASLGAPGWLPAYHRTEMPPFVGVARHALALHELRGWAFPPVLFTRCAGRDVKQVWFAGAHADVGGGYPERALADIAFDWMVHEARRCGGSAQPLALGPDWRRSRCCDIGGGVVHEEISAPGRLWLDAPALRRALTEPGRLVREVVGSFSVHPSALLRLLSPQATRYGFRRGVWLAEVNQPLADADDAALRLQLFLLGPGPVALLRAARWDAGDRQRLDRRLEEARACHGGDLARLTVEIARILIECAPAPARMVTLLAEGWWESASVRDLREVPACIRRFLAGDGVADDDEARAFARGLALLGALVAKRGEAGEFVETVLDSLRREIGPDGLGMAASGRSEEAFRILDSVARCFPEGLKIAGSLQYILLSLRSGVAGASSYVKL